MRKIDKKIFIWVVVGLLTVLTVFFAMSSVSSGARVARLEKEGERLTKENQELSATLIIQTSLSNIGSSADKLGFIKPQETLYFSVSEEVAKAP